MTDRVEQVDGEQVVVKDKEFETTCPKCGNATLECTRKMEAQWVETSKVVDGVQLLGSVERHAVRTHSNGTRFHCPECHHNFNIKWEPRA